MTDEELEKARENYKCLKAKKRKLETVRDRLNLLKQNPLVQEYINLSGILRVNGSVFLTNLIEESFNDVAINTACENNIYVHVGDTSDDWLFAGVPFKSAINSRTLYKNLETKKLIEVRIANKGDFESKHNVIYLKDDADFKTTFQDLRDEFFSEMLEKSQKTAVKKIVMKYGIKE